MWGGVRITSIFNAFLPKALLHYALFQLRFFLIFSYFSCILKFFLRFSHVFARVFDMLVSKT